MESLLYIRGMKQRYRVGLAIFGFSLGLTLLGMVIGGFTAMGVLAFAVLLIGSLGVLGYPRGDERLELLRLKAFEFGIFLSSILLGLVLPGARIVGFAHLGRFDTGENFLAVVATAAFGRYLAAMFMDGRDEKSN